MMDSIFESVLYLIGGIEQERFPGDILALKTG
jgi:hypothetical protein